MTPKLHMQSSSEHLPVSVGRVPKIFQKIKEKVLAVLVARDDSYPETIIDKRDEFVSEEIFVTKGVLHKAHIHNERRNTVFREWDEVPRAKEIISVGDLHGSKRAFELNLQKSGVIDKN